MGIVEHDLVNMLIDITPYACIELIVVILEQGILITLVYRRIGYGSAYRLWNYTVYIIPFNTNWY